MRPGDVIRRCVASVHSATSNSRSIFDGFGAPWKTREALELATLEWVAWFNHQRLHSAIGYIPPAEAEANDYNQLNSAEQQAVLL